jgi:DNA-binding NtrC family response regulator
MLGRSAAMNRVLAAVTRVSGTDFSVLITGESGSGKELVARAVHEQSERRTGPFVAVSCGSLSFETSGADLLERARRGTLYLDEISDMPADLQIRLLRLLEQRDSGRVGGTTELYADSRIIASTTRDPADVIRDGRLRPGLLYRIAVFPIDVPPLRARADDAFEIANLLLRELNRLHGSDLRFSRQAHDFLREHPWPGNVRELRNVVERGFVLADSEIHLVPTLAGVEKEVAHDGLPRAITLQVGNTLEEAERVMIEATLRHLGGSKTRTAAALGCSLKTLYNKLNEYSRLPRLVGT